MSGPNRSSSSSGEGDDLLVYLARLLQQAQAFQKTVQEEFLLTRAQLIDERVRQAKRRRP